MPAKTKDYAGLLKDIRAAEGHKVQVAGTDIDGVLRGRFIHKDHFLKVVEQGLTISDIVFRWDSNDQCRSTGTDRYGYPDVTLVLDMATCRRLPWAQGAPFFLGDFEDRQENPLTTCPRQLLKRIVDRVYKAGFLAQIGTEFEWVNFEETPSSLNSKRFKDPMPISSGMFGYSLVRSGFFQEYLDIIMNHLEDFDVPLESIHFESGPGMLEGSLAKSDPLEAADRAVLFKMAVKKSAYQLGYVASFIARWNSDYPGCCGHIHQSLLNSDGSSAFYDQSDHHGMSSLFKSYVAGVNHCLPDILVMFASNINSYKRFGSDPRTVLDGSWGIDHRGKAMRVIPGDKSTTRLEVRAAGSDMNPYLAIAACLAAGLYGIENNLTLKDEDHTRDFPSNLMTAVERFQGSDIACELFGEDFVNYYSETRMWEWEQSQNSVTDWELKRYLEII